MMQCPVTANTSRLISSPSSDIFKRFAGYGENNAIASVGRPCLLSGFHTTYRTTRRIRAGNDGEPGGPEKFSETKVQNFERNFADVTEEDTKQKQMQLPEECYIGLFVRMLGMDNPVEDREEAIIALRRYSMGGTEYINEIVAFPGILTLAVSLLPSTRSASSEAAAGLLRNISLCDVHRDSIAKSGAVEELIGLLTRRRLVQEVREQASHCLWNLSMERAVRNRVDLLELLPALWSMLDSEGSDQEAAAGILSNFASDSCNHELLVEAGIIQRLATLLKSAEGSKVTREEARKALLELIQNAQFKQIIIEEGLVPVPFIGAHAYKSFKPLLDVAPALPEGLNVKHPSVPSTFGAGELLLGLNNKDNPYDVDVVTQSAIEGRARQHFLGRIGLLEKEASKQESVSMRKKVTIMSWWDGIPRLVLILGLEDITVASLAAKTISEIAINEDIRQAIQKAGSIPHLVRLLGSGDEYATEAAAAALERLAISLDVRKSINAHGAIPALVEIMKADDAPGFVKEKVLMALDRLSQTGEEMQVMIQSGAYPGLLNMAESEGANALAKQEAEGILVELSSRKGDLRDKLVNAGGIPALIKAFASNAPTLKEKAACVLETLAAQESYAALMVSEGIEIPLKSLFEGIAEGNVDTLRLQDVVKWEETWVAVAAGSRLLNKILMHRKVREVADCKGFALLLADVLKSDAPFHVKDWISATLLSLDRLVGITTNANISVEFEVIIHDKIPKLVDEIGSAIDAEIQEAAVIQLRDLVSRGIEGYVAAVSNSGGIFPLVELLKSGTPKAREAALAVLYSLGANEENHLALIRAGVVTPLQRIVQSECPQWTLALYLLRTLPT
ncbi:hypothetical protein KP509_1Z044100 [Ceratopteris richardii]|nr:hypothetical protein KP509_1Z044100 [Ceratopteris richardii]